MSLPQDQNEAIAKDHPTRRPNTINVTFDLSGQAHNEFCAEGYIYNVVTGEAIIVAPSNKPLLKTVIAFCGKLCLVRSAVHVW